MTYDLVPSLGFKYERKAGLAQQRLELRYTAKVRTTFDVVSFGMRNDVVRPGDEVGARS